MLKGRKFAYGLRLIVAPADADTYIKAATAGYLTDVLEAGGLVINHCGSPEVQGRIGKTEVMVSNDLENKPGYAGFETSKDLSYIHKGSGRGSSSWNLRL